MGQSPMRFIHESVIRATPDRVFAFHELPDALPRLTPPWERGHVVALPRSLQVGEQTVVEIRVLGLFRMTDRGKNDFKVFGVPHTGKSFRMMAIDIQTVKDGKIAKTFHMENWLSALGQLRAK